MKGSVQWEGTILEKVTALKHYEVHPFDQQNHGTCDTKSWHKGPFQLDINQNYIYPYLELFNSYSGEIRPPSLSRNTGRATSSQQRGRPMIFKSVTSSLRHKDP